MKNRPRIFFSFRSPFSWMAIARLERAMPDVQERLDWIPFWEPDAKTSAALDAAGVTFHYVPMSKAKHLYILQDTKRLAAALGMPMAWPVDVAPWWEPSHLGWLAARKLGRARQFYRAVVAARWERGEDISTLAVIASAAEAAGLDPEAILSAIDDDEMRAEGVRCLARAHEEDVFGVPYFRAGFERFWGLDRVDAFLHALGIESSSDPLLGVPREVQELTGAYDSDTAGGCG